MPIIEPGNPELKELEGIHLWHVGMSTCSQRVRVTLTELGLDFESHVVNLQKGEHATREYHDINPKGVVPSLIHDGTLIVESVDIIAYLDSTLGGGKLQPEGQEEEIAALLAHADAAQAPLKVCTFEFLFSGAPPKSDEEFEVFVAGLQDAKLQQFHRDFRAGFDRDRVHAAVNAVDKDFQTLEDRLSDGRTWMTGEDFTIADIAWTPNFHRMDLLRWPLDRYPHLSAWFKRVSARPSYESALESWEPKPLFDIALPVLDERRSNNDGIDNYGVLAA